MRTIITRAKYTKGEVATLLTAVALIIMVGGTLLGTQLASNPDLTSFAGLRCPAGTSKGNPDRYGRDCSNPNIGCGATVIDETFYTAKEIRNGKEYVRVEGNFCFIGAKYSGAHNGFVYLTDENPLKPVCYRGLAQVRHQPFDPISGWPACDRTGKWATLNITPPGAIPPGWKGPDKSNFFSMLVEKPASGCLYLHYETWGQTGGGGAGTNLNIRIIDVDGDGDCGGGTPTPTRGGDNNTPTPTRGGGDDNTPTPTRGGGEVTPTGTSRGGCHEPCRPDSPYCDGGLSCEGYIPPAGCNPATQNCTAGIKCLLHENPSSKTCTRGNDDNTPTPTRGGDNNTPTPTRGGGDDNTPTPTRGGGEVTPTGSTNGGCRLPCNPTAPFCDRAPDGSQMKCVGYIPPTACDTKKQDCTPGIKCVHENDYPDLDCDPSQLSITPTDQPTSTPVPTLTDVPSITPGACYFNPISYIFERDPKTGTLTRILNPDKNIWGSQNNHMLSAIASRYAAGDASFEEYTFFKAWNQNKGFDFKGEYDPCKGKGLNCIATQPKCCGYPPSVGGTPAENYDVINGEFATVKLYHDTANYKVVQHCFNEDESDPNKDTIPSNCWNSSDVIFNKDASGNQKLLVKCQQAYRYGWIVERIGNGPTSEPNPSVSPTNTPNECPIVGEACKVPSVDFNIETTDEARITWTNPTAAGCPGLVYKAHHYWIDIVDTNDGKIVCAKRVKVHQTDMETDCELQRDKERYNPSLWKDISEFEKEVTYSANVYTTNEEPNCIVGPRSALDRIDNDDPDNKFKQSYQLDVDDDGSDKNGVCYVVADANNNSRVAFQGGHCKSFFDGRNSDGTPKKLVVRYAHLTGNSKALNMAGWAVKCDNKNFPDLPGYSGAEECKDNEVDRETAVINSGEMLECIWDNPKDNNNIECSVKPKDFDDGGDDNDDPEPTPTLPPDPGNLAINASYRLRNQTNPGSGTYFQDLYPVICESDWDITDKKLYDKYYEALNVSPLPTDNTKTEKCILLRNSDLIDTKDKENQTTSGGDYTFNFTHVFDTKLSGFKNIGDKYYIGCFYEGHINNSLNNNIREQCILKEATVGGSVMFSLLFRNQNGKDVIIKEPNDDNKIEVKYNLSNDSKSGLFNRTVKFQDLFPIICNANIENPDTGIPDVNELKWHYLTLNRNTTKSDKCLRLNKSLVDNLDVDPGKTETKSTTIFDDEKGKELESGKKYYVGCWSKANLPWSLSSTDSHCNLKPVYTGNTVEHNLRISEDRIIRPSIQLINNTNQSISSLTLTNCNVSGDCQSIVNPLDLEYKNITTVNNSFNTNDYNNYLGCEITLADGSKKQCSTIQATQGTPLFITINAGSNIVDTKSETSEQRADLDKNGICNTLDYATFVKNYTVENKSDRTQSIDLNFDNRVDASDLSMTTSCLGKTAQ